MVIPFLPIKRPPKNKTLKAICRYWQSDHPHQFASVDLGIRTGTVRKDQAIRNTETSTFLNDWWLQNGVLPPREMKLLKWMEKHFWHEMDKPTDTGQTHERISIYMTGTGDHSHQPHVRHGKTFFIPGEGDATIRQQFELDANKLGKLMSTNSIQ